MLFALLLIRTNGAGSVAVVGLVREVVSSRWRLLQHYSHVDHSYRAQYSVALLVFFVDDEFNNQRPKNVVFSNRGT